MTFDEVLEQVRELLQNKGRVAYRALKRRFEIDDEYVEDLKAELIDAEHVAHDEDGKVLVWSGEPEERKAKSVERGKAELQEPSVAPRPTLHALRSDGERRQLTVEFIDLVGSTTLSQQLDPEDYHGRVRAYQAACRQVIARYEGHIAQYLGDGVLVYFGYPAAHEDDAVRAVRSGLEIVTAVRQLAYTPPLQVRIGIHTGPVVVGEIGAGERTERLALGETPNIAARVQGTANPDDVVISAATYHLVEGLFTCEARGQPALKGVATPLTLYQVVKESEAHSRFEVAVQAGLTPLVGRDEELALLHRCWYQAQGGAGQVVLLSGEPGIGKSRLVQELRNAATQAGAVPIEYRCSSYHQNSAFYPLTEHLQRVLHFMLSDTPQDKLRKLEQALSRYHFPQNDTVPLLAALLSLPQAGGSPPLYLTPQQQKQKTLGVLVRWLFEEAEQAPVYAIWEDLHWADPSTLEFLTVCLDQTPTARMLMVLTGRPEFTPTWASRSHVSHLVLSRLGRQQSSAIVKSVTGGKGLPQEVTQQIANKTDGVPLFVEELTKMVVESGLVREAGGRYELNGPLPPLAIPSTLQDSLMARLDRLASVRDIAQLGATIGREFTYELLRAVSPLNEDTLQRGLKQLVAAELVYQSGLPPQARYLFKHALVQDTAYQSLLKSTRQQYHQRIAQVLGARFVETVETQPELVAHHYTEAGLIEHALPYWQRAGQRAAQQSAHQEVIAHLSKALEVLKVLPDLPERAEKELEIQMAVGPAFMALEGWAAAEVGRTYARARELCQQIGETPKLFPVLYGLWRYYNTRGKGDLARESGEQLVVLAQRQNDAALLLLARQALGSTLYFMGEFALARPSLEEAKDFRDDDRHRTLALHYGTAPGVQCLAYGAQLMWFMGYPTQARHWAREAVRLARRLNHSHSEAMAVYYTARLEVLRRDAETAYEQARAAISLSTEQGFASFRAMGTFMQGWAQVEQGHKHEGLEQMHEGLRAIAATGNDVARPLCLGVLAEVHSRAGQFDAGWSCVTEALVAVEESGRRDYEAELHRLRGELTLAQSQTSLGQVKTSQSKSEDTAPRPLTPDPQADAEACFHKAIDIARKQQAKSLELRAVMSLVRLRQQQAVQHATRNTHHEAHARLGEAHQMLSEIYNWFTEGFDTKDLQEAETLLEELSHENGNG
jgi:predicted ATPase/class 3 adenylate cyclase